MTGDQFAALLDRAGLRQVDLGRLVKELTGKPGPNRVTVNRYCHGRLPVPPLAAALLECFCRLPGESRQALRHRIQG